LSAEGRAFHDAWERRNTPEERNRLADELQRHYFSAGDGAKLVVTGVPPPQEYEKICAEADRFLWHVDHERDLMALRGSRPGQQKARLEVSQQTFPLKEIFAVAVLLVVVVVVGVFGFNKIASSHKKKVPEVEPVAHAASLPRVAN